MKKFTEQEIRIMLNQIYRGEISFSRMVEVINQRISEAEDTQEELKKGDLAIFWDDMKEHAFVHVFNKFTSHSDLLPYTGMNGLRWKNAIKFESIEQYERFIKGEK